MIRNQKLGVLGAAAFVLAAATSSHAIIDTIRINAGATEPYTDSKGRLWAPDSGYSGGTTYSGNNITISGTEDQGLHTVERYAQGEDLIYNFDVAPGTYTVRLYNGTIWNGACGVGNRIFNIVINGTTVLADYDMYLDVGEVCNAADVKTFKVEAPTGKINITLQVVVENPKVNAIEIVPWDPASIMGASKGGMNRFSVASSNGGLLVHSRVEGAYTLELKDLQGRLVQSKKGFGAGSQSFTNLRPGLYLLTSVSGNETVTRKVNVVR